MENIELGPPYSPLVKRLQEVFGLSSDVANIVVKFLKDEGVLDYETLIATYYEDADYYAD